MAAVIEKYLTDVVMAVIKLSGGTSYTWETGQKVSAKMKIEEIKGVKLIVHGKLKAQKRDKKVITGTEITFEDNAFLPEVVKVLQGGTIVMDTETPTKFKSYTPLAVGEEPNSTPFDLEVYIANYNESGDIVNYSKVSYPHCVGDPIDMDTENDKFFAPKYTIISTPAKGTAPYVLEDVDALPNVGA